MHYTAPPVRTAIAALLAIVRAAFVRKANLALENAALRQQLAAYLRQQKRPRLQPEERVFWVVLKRLWPSWAKHLIVVKPKTVIGWHRKGFRALWCRRSNGRKPGRPRIPRKHIAFIKRMSRDHPDMGENAIAEELEAKFGIKHAPSTVRPGRSTEVDHLCSRKVDPFWIGIR